MYLPDIISLETALLKRIIERNDQLMDLFQANSELLERNGKYAKRIGELEEQLRLLSGPSVVEKGEVRADDNGTV